MEKKQFIKDWDLLTQFFPEDWEKQAKNLGALKRQRKFKSASDLLRLLLIHLADGCSMRETTTRAKQGGLTSISDVALLKRLRASTEWLRWMTIKMLHHRGFLFASPEYLSDYKIKTVDATVISEPGSTGTDWRLHYSMKLFTLQCDQFIISRQDVGESFTNFKVEKGDLFIGDRAYGRLKGLKYIRQNGGHFLARLKNKAFKIYNPDGKEINILQQLKSLAIGKIMELDVYADNKSKSKLEMRLFAVRKSDEDAEKSIQKALRDHSRKQRKVNPETLELQRYVILVSSLPKSITSYQITELYRVRWQIEVAFKRLKSIMGLGHLPKTDIRSCRAWLHGKLFVTQLVQSIIEAGCVFSPWGYPIRP